MIRREAWYDERDPAPTLSYVVAFESYRSRMVDLDRPFPRPAHVDGLLPVDPDDVPTEVDAYPSIDRVDGTRSTLVRWAYNLASWLEFV